jgi:hypothetical protein
MWGKRDKTVRAGWELGWISPPLVRPRRRLRGAYVDLVPRSSVRVRVHVSEWVWGVDLSGAGISDKPIPVLAN